MSYLVYKHTAPNGKVYIGITSRTAKERWRNNGTGYHHNEHWESAIKKYGWENIKHEILLTGLTKEEAEQKEVDLIAFYKSNQREYGYNIANGGGVNRGFHIREKTKEKIRKSLKKYFSKNKSANYGKRLSDEAKQKLRLANIGKKLNEETKLKISIANKGKAKPQAFKELVRRREQRKVSNILQVSFNGEIVNIFNSIQEASRKTNAEANKICAVCKGKRKSTKGFIWLYEKDKPLIDERLKTLKGRA